jgi:NADH-quinone oxidoreductase subunit L
MIDFSYTVWILLIPLIMFVVVGLFGNRFKPLVSGIAGTAGLFVMWILSLITAYKYFFVLEKAADGTFQKFLAFNMRWLNLTDTLHIDMGVLLDPISIMMLIVITSVSFMVHVYSIGYMDGEKGFMRFFSMLSLFSFSMLGLVVATNIFQMYIFWELVGVSSYLLIGFYYTRDSAVSASKKAFIVTRFADLGFLIGILMLSFATGTFDFLTLTGANSPAFSSGTGIMFLGLIKGGFSCSSHLRISPKYLILELLVGRAIIPEVIFCTKVPYASNMPVQKSRICNSPQIAGSG